MKQSTKRIVVDIILVFLLVFEMFYLVTGNLAHEIVGVTFFICLGLHLYLSRKIATGLFTKNEGSRKQNSKGKIVHRVIDILLFATIALLLISSLFISNILIGIGFSIGLGSYGLWALIHTISAYALCVIVVFHGALHWTSLFKGMRIPYNPERRQAITSFATTCAALGTVALGLASVDNLKNHLQAYAVENDMGEESDAFATSNSDGGISVQDNNEGSYSRSSTYRQRSSQQRSSTNTNNSQNSANSSSKSGSSSTSENSDICPLCSKRCSLANPKCNKPYRAGLI